MRLAKQDDVATVRFAVSTLASLAEDKVRKIHIICAQICLSIVFVICRTD